MFQPHSVIESTIIIIEAAVRARLSDRVGRTGAQTPSKSTQTINDVNDAGVTGAHLQ